MTTTDGSILVMQLLAKSDRLQNRVLQLENILATMRDAHDIRVSELLAANNVEVQRRRDTQANYDRVANKAAGLQQDLDEANLALEKLGEEMDCLRDDQHDARTQMSFRSDAAD